MKRQLPERHWEFFTLARVKPQATGWAVFVEGWCIGVPPISAVVPQVGMRIGLYGRGIGYPVERVTLGEYLVYDLSGQFASGDESVLADAIDALRSERKG